MKILIYSFIVFIFTSHTQASVKIQNICEAEVKVTKIEPHDGFEWMKFVVLSKSDKGTDKKPYCSICKISV